ncbi:MAG: hypothetical protein EOO54_29505 [Haliea sp.]|nr:MAG: hypothetical protein EOO54_29505 [Haliea sp.]
MKYHRSIASLAFGVALANTSGTALAESTYGYNAAGTGTVTATARVNLRVTVAKLILLRVGSANAVVDTAAWTVGATIPAGPTTPVTGNNTAVNWNGAAPTLTASASPAAFNVYAWTNATTPTINCAMGAWTGPAGGPTNANFTVTVAGTLPHPGANLGACAATAFPANALATGTWQYAIGGTPGTWPAGVYTNSITYTAQGL